MGEINRLRSVVRELNDSGFNEIVERDELINSLSSKLFCEKKERASWARAFAMFITHLPLGFIDKIWGDNPHICEHFKAKLEGYCLKDGYASYTAMMQFFHSLSKHHQEKFCNFIVDWWVQVGDDY